MQCAKIIEIGYSRLNLVKSWNRDQKALLQENSRSVYTDGSECPLRAGAGIYFGNLAEDQSIPLGKNVTVFQAETYAIQQCVCTLKSISVTGELINIYSVIVY